MGIHADPDVRRLCRVCCGPVYRDEPGTACPDCRSAMDALARVRAAAPPGAGDAREPRVHRILLDHDAAGGSG